MSDDGRWAYDGALCGARLTLQDGTVLECRRRDGHPGNHAAHVRHAADLDSQEGIYVASSWRNEYHAEVLEALHDGGYAFYDFKNPAPGDNGFSWSEIDPHWQAWTPKHFIGALDHPVAKAGFQLDMTALQACWACILVLPCGRSAHLEAGYAIGANKPTAIYWPHADVVTEPELMYAMAAARITSMGGLMQWLKRAEAERDADAGRLSRKRRILV